MAKKTVLRFLLLLLVPASALASPKDEASKLLDRYVSAYNSADANAIAVLFAERSEFYSLQNRLPLVTQLQIRKHFEPLTKFKYRMKYDRVSYTTPSDNVVLASATERYNVGRNSTDFRIETRTTFTIVKIDQVWKIVGYHRSQQPDP